MLVYTRLAPLERIQDRNAERLFSAIERPMPRSAWQLGPDRPQATIASFRTPTIGGGIIARQLDAADSVGRPEDA
jgi:hypothetical protein